MTKITDEILELFNKIRMVLGAPVRSVELTDEMMCSHLDFCIADYAERVQNEIIANNWMSFYGKRSGANSNALAEGFMLRTLDMAKDYSYYYSKMVGLQSNGPWELKKDFIKIEEGRQVYAIPSGRTVNKVMWLNPSMTDLALFGNSMAGTGLGIMPGMGPIGFPAGYGRGSGFYTTQMADVAYTISDLNMKRSIYAGDLVYYVTAGPEGTHLIHLLSTPGNRVSFGFAGMRGDTMGLVDCYLWYTYYETPTEEEQDACTRLNVDNVILRPDQISLTKIDYAFLNEPAQTIIRQMLVGKLKQALGNIRGKFSGKVNIPQAEMTMDYQMLLQQGLDEYQKAMDTLNKNLERLRPVNVMKENDEMMDHQKNIIDKTPLGIFAI